ncbi:6-phosphogluconolactonase [Psychrosphaera sp. B3R10]|uniref:6-phosphogluconolactonase n=1 Tax=unclassified Psychrosphaera TaxID=2641570 RepID=UPI001C0A3E42|nr:MULTISPECIES: 6-phosphogluconolactonase [unclassified Psychrosphaera]MBU2882179.1 6-phosphogluconolactonase [Psychrosphaera sp. I2R16]MBU2988860.1 6-phosphogluconolactonase [Psychrosphaera sp. B3R10]
MKAELRKFQTSAELNDVFAPEIAAKLQAGIDQDGRASLLVSGGSTPRPMFAKLSEIDIDWSKVDIALVDDRWVNTDDSASNEKMAYEALLINKAASAKFYGMKTEHEDAFAAVSTVTTNLASLKKPFDIVILGMGEDGHTASIFPCCEQLDEALTTQQMIMATQPTTAPHQRMTFTLSALLNSKQIYLHLVGESKETVLNEVIGINDIKKAPIKAFLNQSDVPMSVMLATTK